MKEIAILGFGTVGQGVYQILEEKKEKIKQIIGEEIHCPLIMVKDLEKERHGSAEFTNNFQEILDRKPDLIVELTGTEEEAFQYLSTALKRKIPVVTANKAVVSKYFEKLLDLADENKTSFQYEASVGGCIPIIKPLKEEARFNDVDTVEGILNGTCNYILTKMQEEGKDYGEVLKDAQELGFAEADPTADVSGMDSLRKLRILLTIAFGASVKEEDILLRGIEEIKKKDIEFIQRKNYGIKLIASGFRKDNCYDAIVEPCLLKPSHLLYDINNELNSVLIGGDYLNQLVLTGYGAGKLPTGDAVVRDILDIFMEEDISTEKPKGLLDNSNEKSKGRYYIRVKKEVDVPLEIEVQEEKEGEKYLILSAKRKDILELTKKDGFFARIMDESGYI
ncbi:MAG: homoserine dehydrogenase [Tissierellia bacterium]|nr:homoserine dehydrogenase [Tissierellia bacterium]